MADAIQLKKIPDRVPVVAALGGFAQAYCGYTERDIYDDIDKAVEVATKGTLEFQLDTQVAGGITRLPGVMELLDWKLHGWPEDPAGELQFYEGEYMKEDEYDAFLEDPTGYCWKTYLPRIMGTFGPLSKTPYWPYTGMTTVIPTSLTQFARPETQTSLEKLVEAGKQTMVWQQKMGVCARKLAELGFPGTGGGTSRAPFDALGDAMRGTRGICRDMFKQPEKLLKALDKVATMMTNLGLESARLGGYPVVGFPLHKGADGFMSEEQFKTFYWPSLFKVCQGLWKEGLVVRLGAQGGYNSRLELIGNTPKGQVIWGFGAATDMARAKELLGDVACISGNVPAALLTAGTVDQVTAYCRRLIDTTGKGGGYMLGTAAIDRTAKVENVKAMINCAKEYGVYA